MTSRSRFLACLVAVPLAAAEGRSTAQDTPLYRDPSPSEGARILGPLLPARPTRPGATPPPPSGLGPFQIPALVADPSGTAGPSPAAPEAFREPLLVIAPMPSPLPALPMPPIQVGEPVEVRRTTKIRGPNGVLGRFHDWFRDTLLGPPRPPAADGRASPGPSRTFNWPSWPLGKLGG